MKRASSKQFRSYISRVVSRKKVGFLASFATIPVIVSLFFGLSGTSVLHAWDLLCGNSIFIRPLDELSIEAGKRTNVMLDLQNLTSREQGIVGIRTGCSCSVPLVDFPLRVEAHESELVTLQFTAGDKLGRVAVSFELYLSDGTSVPGSVSIVVR